MSKREVEDYLQDILDAVAAIEQFTISINFEDFSQNLEKVFAVSRAIEIIGEAVKRIPDSVRSQYPDIPWRDVAGMRDKLIYNYFNPHQRSVGLLVLTRRNARSRHDCQSKTMSPYPLPIPQVPGGSALFSQTKYLHHC